MEQLKIENVELKDAEALLEIYAPYVTDTAVSFEYDVPTLKEFENRIVNISAKYPYLKAVKNGEILGYAYAAPFHERPAYAWSVETTIYLREECKGQGIGRALYTQLESRLRAMGILNMNACIAVPKTEDDSHLTMDSIYFHTRMGFTPVGVFHDSGFKFDTWYDMEWMEKMLGEHKENCLPVNFTQCQMERIKR